MANFMTDCVFFDSVSMRVVLWATFAHLRTIRGQAAWLGPGRRRLPAQDPSNNSLSTNRRVTGILVNLHPILPRDREIPQGPDGQPIEFTPGSFGSKKGQSAYAASQGRDPTLRRAEQGRFEARLGHAQPA